MSGLTEKISGLYKGVKNIGRSSLLIGSLIPVILGFGACGKKDNPFIPPIDPLQPVITGSVYNLTTGNNTLYEINDTMRVVATGQDPEGYGFGNFYVGIFKNGVEVGRLTDAVAGNNLGLDDTIKIDDPNMVGDLQFKVVYRSGAEGEHGEQLIGQGKCEAERDYLNIANSYNITKGNIAGLAQILSDSSVITQTGKHVSYEQVYNYLKNMTDGIEDNFEVKIINLDDIRGDSGSYNAGAIMLVRTDGYNDALYTNSEETMNRLKQFYGVQ